jgi:hypothetical protein
MIMYIPKKPPIRYRLSIKHGLLLITTCVYLALPSSAQKATDTTLTPLSVIGFEKNPNMHSLPMFKNGHNGDYTSFNRYIEKKIFKAISDDIRQEWAGTEIYFMGTINAKGKLRHLSYVSMGDTDKDMMLEKAGITKTIKNILANSRPWMAATNKKGKSIKTRVLMSFYI